MLVPSANDHRLLLVSASPRRRLLLPLLGYPVEVRAVDVDETPRPGERPDHLARRLATDKAEAAGPARPGEVIVGADTVVSLDGVSLGKPENAADATRLLRELRGRRHLVISGIALRDAAKRSVSLACETRVEMRSYENDEIAAYVASGRPLDKAGAYAIQDLGFAPVARLEGCYLNVVGLPLCAVSEALRRLGWQVPAERFDPPCRLCLAGQALLRA